MQHRRAASDTTAFLFKGGLADLLNEGSASDKTSPNMTPLMSHLNKSTGKLTGCSALTLLCFCFALDAIAHSFLSHDDVDRSPSKELSPQTPRKFSQVVKF